MKKTFLLLGAAALAATTLNAADYTITSSPRAAGNQTPIVNRSVETPATTVTYMDSGAALASPRAKANQIVKVAGTNNEVNPALVCRNKMTGSPKTVAACADNPSHPACKVMSVAETK